MINICDLQFNYKIWTFFLRIHVVIWLFSVPVVVNSQTVKWVYSHQWQGSSGFPFEFIRDIIVRPNGNIYIGGATGTSFVPAESINFTIINLNTNGGEKWIYTLFPSPSSRGNYRCFSITYGLDNNIYGVGMQTIASIDTIGNERWYINGPPMCNSVPLAGTPSLIVYGVDNNIYTAGYIYPPDSAGYTSGRDWRVLSITNNGVIRWIFDYDPKPGIKYWAEARSLCYGNDGFIYVTGYSCDSVVNQLGGALTVAKISTSGNLQWTYIHPGHSPSGGYFEGGYDIIQGHDGNIYVSGGILSNNANGLIVSLDTTGNLRWAYTTPADYLCKLVYGQDNNIYATGRIMIAPGNYGALIVSLTSSGLQRWIDFYDTPSYEEGNDVIYGTDNKIYILGRTFNTQGASDDDGLVMCYTPSGSREWIWFYNGNNNTEVFWKGVLDLSNNNLYAVGCKDAIFSTSFTAMVCIGLPQQSTKENTKSVVSQNELKIIPNPFLSSARVIGTEQKDYIIYDITGRIVGIFKGDRIGDGLTGGVYFIVPEDESLSPVQVVKIR